MSKRVLITGGAGFIGSHVADELLRQGHRVRALDSLCAQVHGEDAGRPAYLDPDVELVVGDVRDRAAVDRALADVDLVIHLAAKVGVGQSMYELGEYTSVNNLGTAVLLEALIQRPVERLVVASSMSIYGEGVYRAPDGRLVPGHERTREQLEAGRWELETPDGEPLAPVPTPETKVPALTSIYALSKYDQERLCLITGRAYQIPTVALRLFNVFGPRQALSNPYTGVLAIFGSRFLNNRRPLVFEDGNQQRDFVHVTDVARAFRLALTAPEAVGLAINVGSGQHHTIRSIAERMAAALGKEELLPEITGDFRAGDIRHCFGDLSLASQALGYRPSVPFDGGLRELGKWLEGQVAVDRVAEACSALRARGLTLSVGAGAVS